MIVILKSNAEEQKVKNLVEEFEAQNLKIHYSQGTSSTILGLVGDTAHVDTEKVLAHEVVEDVRRISEPYKAANRRFHPLDTIIEVGGSKIGAGTFTVIAGPCSVESQSQMETVAASVKQSGAAFLRGGAFKPRTSPYSFQGLETEGLRLLSAAKKATGLPIVTEIMSETQLDDFEDVDIIQVGARNMQNFRLLKELGHCKKPILLKRGLANTIEELLMSAEYILAGGNNKVILCERGIRTFETCIRNNLDISAVPVLKRQTHLPVIIDPSHAAGNTWMIEPLSRAAIAAGADGLMIEVHNNPKAALCDGAQSLDMEQFANLMQDIKRRVDFEGRVLQGQ
jgi:3-deoxy-7-phosphoheptulonate synthase